MPKSSQWITPFMKQCFVTAGVMFSMVDCGLVMGYSTSLLPQLQRPESTIPLDATSVSWLASITVIAFLPSNFVVPIIMGKYGRRISNIVGVVPNVIGWIIIATATNFTSLVIAGLLQGFAMGMISVLASVLVAEYTSPKNRGVFLTSIPLATAVGILFVQSVGLYVFWKITAMACACFAFVDLLIVLYSPESPSWLIDQGRYEEAKKIFRWLRGSNEDAEINAMIDANRILSEEKTNRNVKMRLLFTYCKETVTKREFYRPIFIVIHLVAMFHWCGSHTLLIFAVDVINNIVGSDSYTSLIIISIGIQRPISTLIAMFWVKKARRRTMLITTVGLNIVTLLAIAGYLYAQSHRMLPFDHPFIGITLIHLHMFSISTGALNLPLIISGELFPLEYRTLSTSICVITGIPNCLIPVATMPFLLQSIGLSGAYCLYAGVLAYCLAISCTLLPETKDRTLQDIEEEFRGRHLNSLKLKAIQPLTLSES